MEHIFKYKDGRYNNEYFWNDYIDDDERCFLDYLYAVDDMDCSTVHKSIKSAIYDNMTGYVDELQDERELRNDELYVVTYYKYLEDFGGLETCVDFGITKQEIIDNVLAQKYVEGASYFTMGQMMFATRNWLEWEAKQGKTRKR